VNRHEVHGMNTHSAERRSLKQTKQHVVQGIEPGGIVVSSRLTETTLFMGKLLM